MVQLKAGITAFILISFLFQFLHGTIKRTFIEDERDQVPNFNSFMVQLKVKVQDGDKYVY